MSAKHHPELSFDGCGINGPDKYRSRLATFAAVRSADAWHYGLLFAAAPEMKKALELAEPALVAYSNSGRMEDRFANADGYSKPLAAVQAVLATVEKDGAKSPDIPAEAFPSGATLAENVLCILREMPSDWLQTHSLFNDEQARLIDAAGILAGLEREPSTIRWGERGNDFETTCGKLAAIVTEAPARPITRARVLKAYKGGAK